MAEPFGDSFSRTLILLKEKWQMLLYPLLGAFISFVVTVPITLAIGFFYFRPLIENVDQLPEDEVFRWLVNSIFNPGLGGALVFMIVLLIILGMQSFLVAAQTGVYREAILGERVSLGTYFKSGSKYWVRVLAVLLTQTAIFGVPVILFFKYAFLNNIEQLAKNPGIDFFIQFASFSIVMFLLWVLFGIVSYFWLPSLIIGEKDFVEAIGQSAKLGFKKIVYLVTLVVVMGFVYTILSLISNINPQSGLLGLLMAIVYYLIGAYFGIFKFVWYHGIITDGITPPPIEPINEPIIESSAIIDEAADPKTEV